MPRITGDILAKGAVKEAAERMKELLKLPDGVTEFCPGPEGYVIICLHKKPDRTDKILEQIWSIFKEELIKVGLGYIKVVGIASGSGEWFKI